EVEIDEFPAPAGPQPRLRTEDFDRPVFAAGETQVPAEPPATPSWREPTIILSGGSAAMAAALSAVAPPPPAPDPDDSPALAAARAPARHGAARLARRRGRRASGRAPVPRDLYRPRHFPPRRRREDHRLRGRPPGVRDLEPAPRSHGRSPLPRGEDHARAARQ